MQLEFLTVVTALSHRVLQKALHSANNMVKTTVRETFLLVRRLALGVWRQNAQASPLKKQNKGTSGQDGWPVSFSWLYRIKRG